MAIKLISGMRADSQQRCVYSVCSCLRLRQREPAHKDLVAARRALSPCAYPHLQSPCLLQTGTWLGGTIGKRTAWTRDSIPVTLMAPWSSVLGSSSVIASVPVCQEVSAVATTCCGQGCTQTSQDQAVEPPGVGSCRTK